MRTSSQIKADIISDFEGRVSDEIQDGSAIDIYTSALSSEYERIYEEIDANKTPHIWSSLEGWRLDDMGIGLNLPRRTGEPDTTYRYRLMNWTLSNEASNTIAIQNALLNMTYASDVDYQPYTKGSGTGTCYVIPKEYTQEVITAALEETAERLANIADPSLYIEYIVPTMKSVVFQCYISVSDSVDIDYVKANIESKARDYVNAVPPREWMSAGEVNKIGVNEEGVEYFNVLSLLIDNVESTDFKILQGIDTKLIYDEIVWF